MRKIFYDEGLDIDFRSKGYVVVPFFDADEVSKADEIFEKYALKSDKSFYLSIWNNDVPSRISVHSRIQPIVHNRAKDILVDYKFLISCYAVKMNSSDSSWGLHQDDSFTDESKFESLSIWIALTDVDSNNGAMRVLEGSQNIYIGPRSPTISKFFSPGHETLLQKMIPVSMKAGEAIIFNHRLLHDSGINNGKAPRIACVSVLIPQEAPVLFYYNNSGMVDIIHLDEEYYLKFKLGDRPEGRVEQVELLSNLLPKEKSMQ